MLMLIALPLYIIVRVARVWWQALTIIADEIVGGIRWVVRWIRQFVTCHRMEAVFVLKTASVAGLVWLVIWLSNYLEQLL
ncbi:MAG TPA: hypothetical protein VI953_03015 [Candidatus Paceibacterota bacterium]